MSIPCPVGSGGLGMEMEVLWGTRHRGATPALLPASSMGHTVGQRRCGASPGASVAISGDQVGFFPPSLSPQLCLLGRESPKAILTHYAAAPKCTSRFFFFFFPFKTPSFQQAEAEAGSNVGRGHGTNPSAILPCL